MNGKVYRNIFFGLDFFCVVIFIIEFIVCLYVVFYRLDFVRDLLNIIDLLGIIFYYIMVVERVVNFNNVVLGFVVMVFCMFRVF